MSTAATLPVVQHASLYRCSKRLHPDRSSAEAEWTRLRRIDPAGNRSLICYWCGRCHGWHIGHRRT
jgi:hypothetical protein